MLISLSYSFLKMISAAAGGTVINYSDRFTLSGMTGTFPPNVVSGIAGVTGTGGPPTENNIDNAAAVPTAGGAEGPYAVTYTAQTGLTKYAPMQGKPGTKITAMNPTPQYPTSSVRMATTILPTPSQVTTQTLSATYSIPGQENTVLNPLFHYPMLYKGPFMLANKTYRLHLPQDPRETCRSTWLVGGIEEIKSYCL